MCLLIADLVVHDENLISKILDGGLRELSAGYDTDYVPQDDGTFEQTKIRINHVALVPTGRCGPACRVHDHHKEQSMTRDERKQLAEAMESKLPRHIATKRRIAPRCKPMTKISESERKSSIGAVSRKPKSGNRLW